LSAILRYAINHMVAPSRSIAELIELAADLELEGVELRNDVPGGSPADDPARVRELASAAGVRILSINALQRFNDWTPAREAEARALAGAAQACGAEMLALCPVNDAAFSPAESERLAGLRKALKALAPILADAGIMGLIEPLGFATSSLRMNWEAVEAIEDQDLGDRFRIVHDTFHHYLAGEPHLLPEWTALVHISGVDRDIPLGALRDEHRVLVDADDGLGNIGQIIALLAGGYSGPFAFEPFAASVRNHPDIAAALATSMHWIDAEIAKAQI
jgi:2-keto-myo-inositol isomerase